MLGVRAGDRNPDQVPHPPALKDRQVKGQNNQLGPAGRQPRFCPGSTGPQASTGRSRGPENAPRNRGQPVSTSKPPCEKKPRQAGKLPNKSAAQSARVIRAGSKPRQGSEAYGQKLVLVEAAIVGAQRGPYPLGRKSERPQATGNNPPRFQLPQEEGPGGVRRGRGRSQDRSKGPPCRAAENPWQSPVSTVMLVRPRRVKTVSAWGGGRRVRWAGPWVDPAAKPPKGIAALVSPSRQLEHRVAGRLHPPSGPGSSDPRPRGWLGCGCCPDARAAACPVGLGSKMDP